MTDKQSFREHFPNAVCSKNGMRWEVTAAGLILGTSYVSAGHAWNSAYKHVRCTRDWNAGTYRIAANKETVNG